MTNNVTKLKAAAHLIQGKENLKDSVIFMHIYIKTRGTVYYIPSLSLEINVLWSFNLV
jgi:hypothetical protein